MKLGNLKPAGRLYVGAVLLIQLLVVWNARDLIWKGYPDFTIYYTAGTIIRQGMGHSLYDNGIQFEVQKEFAPQVAIRLGALPFNHPPFEALLFVPFTYLSYRVAYLLWLLANLAMLATLPILLRPYVQVLAGWSVPLCTLVGLIFFPIFFALLQGQDAILLMFLYGLSFASMKKGCMVSAGAWLACGLFKFHLVLPFFILLLIQEKETQRRMKILWGFLLVGAMLGVVSILAVGTRQVISYPAYVLGLEKTMAQGAIMPSDMPNLRGALYLIASRLHSFDLLVVSFSVVVFLVAARISHLPDRHSDDLNYVLAVFATVLVSYHGLGYDLCVLALPVSLLAGWLKTGWPQDGSGSRRWNRAAIGTGMAALLFSPLQLVLLMRYNRLALLGWAVLLCFVGIAAELGSRTQRLAA
jgi:hypothetical protein